MKLSFILFAFLTGSTVGQDHQSRHHNQEERDWKAAPEPGGISNIKSKVELLSTTSTRSLNEASSMGESLAHIGDRAWSEHEFSAEDYEDAKDFIEAVRANVRSTVDTDKEADYIIKNMDIRHILEELFPNINLDESLKDSRKLYEDSEDSDEIKDFMVEFENHAQNFPYNDALKKSKELETINLSEMYEQEGVDIENKESSVNVHTMATFLEGKGVITTEDANVARDFFNSRDEFHRKLSACSESIIGLFANVFLLVLAIFQVPSASVGKASSSLARQAMKKIAIEEAKGLAVGFAVGQATGAIANFIDKVICGGLSISQIMSAVKDSISSWWTWLLFAIELAATLAAFFVTGGWYLAFKLVSVLVGAVAVVKSAIDAGNACSVSIPTKSVTGTTESKGPKGRCGPLFGGRSCDCSGYEKYCNTANGWCGNTDAHKDAQAGSQYDCRPGSQIVDKSKTFYIRNPATNKYLDVKYSKCHNGNPLILYQFNGSVAQQFYFGPNGSIMNAGCDKPLDITGGSCDDGAIVQMWDYHGGSNQQFEKQGNILLNKKCNKAIDNAGGSSANFNTILMWSANKGSNQQWEIRYK